MNFTSDQQNRILRSPKKYLVITDQEKLIFTNDPSIHLKWDFINDFKLYTLKDLKKNVIEKDYIEREIKFIRSTKNFHKYDKQLQDLQGKLEALNNSVIKSDWQNAKFVLSDPTN